jgi:hypothetical protein
MTDLTGTRTEVAGFDGARNHWIRVKGGNEPGSVFMAFSGAYGRANNVKIAPRGGNGLTVWPSGQVDIPVRLQAGEVSANKVDANTLDGNVLFSGDINNRNWINSYGVSTTFLEVLVPRSAESTKVQSLDGCLKKVNQLAGKSFELTPEMAENMTGEKAAEDMEHQTCMSLDADSLREQLPGLVREAGENALAVDYMGLIPVLVEAVKELTAKVETLEKTKAKAK